MTPVGAMCAVHVGEPAVVTCDRCGNFMCVQCAGGRTSTKCPSCVEATSTSRFPYGPDATFDSLWTHAQSAWRRELGMLTVACLVWMGITLAGSVAANIVSSIMNTIVGLGGKGTGLGFIVVSSVLGQVIGAVVSAVVQAVALTGFYRVLMDVLLGRTVDLGRMFSHMFLLPRMIALQLIMAVLFTLPILAIFGVSLLWAISSSGISLDSLNQSDVLQMMPKFFGSIAVSMVLVFVLVAFVLPVSLYAVPELMVGDCGPFEAVTRAWKLGSGQRLRLLGYSFVSGIVMLVGMVACLVGVLPALPLAYLVLLALFLALRNGSGLPAAKFD